MDNPVNLLHREVQRWIWQQGWTELRPVQEMALEPVLRADSDLIISAATAAGKTEAAFLPAISRLATNRESGVGILYISPLKALINDQYRRLESLCRLMDLPLTPWHGDVSVSIKNRQKKNPSGIILITPESLEAMFLHRASWCHQAFSGLRYFIIDEFHSFLGTPRGYQLLSLMHRLEFLIQKYVPRIALSATLGNMVEVAKQLRPASGKPCQIINGGGKSGELKIQLRGYQSSAVYDSENQSVIGSIVVDLYRLLRGKSHLIFANSRNLTEEIAAGLSELCEQNFVPNEFFPHHGNLSREMREGLEKRFQDDKLPTSAVCTTTLELGIDIGSVDSIAQVTVPHSVAGLRQRLGRSGRRGEAAVLRLFIAEQGLNANSGLGERLRIEIFQCVAMINLLLQKWFEPPESESYQFSTLIQQTLSVIGQYGGVQAGQLWSLLCETGPFKKVQPELYARFLRELGNSNLISQSSDGQIIMGLKGENVVGHYSFYTAFKTPLEYRLEANGKILGTVPFYMGMEEGQMMIFGGRKWEIIEIDPERKLISLRSSTGGKAPVFGGSGLLVHDIIRKEMYKIYSAGLNNQEIPSYLDGRAAGFFREGLHCFSALHLAGQKALQIGSSVFLLPWCGDKIANTLMMILHRQELQAGNNCGIIEVHNCDLSELQQNISRILQKEPPRAEELAALVPETAVGKHDAFLSKELCDLDYGASFFDVSGAWSWLQDSVTV
jgi:ATP-dependent Lhr-like helicase